jgi:hypothetical protein
VTLTAADVAAPLARYARRLHAAAGARHHVASPLGAWLLLALCAPASEGPDRGSVNEALGCDAAEAADLARALLASPHPLVPAAAGVWHHAPATSPALARWLAGLPPQVQAGPLASQAELNDWARRHTFGLIDRFPLPDPSIWLLVATVLATRVAWERPFDLAPASALGPSSPWSAGPGRVLRTPDGPGHEQFVAATEAAGDVAVHTARARGGLLVTSVAAAPGVPADAVLAAAYDLAVARAVSGRAPAGPPSGGPAPRGTVGRRSLFDLPLGDGPLWAISERSAPTKAAGGREERCTAVLPAWSARSEHDLSDPALGFAAAARALAGGDPWQARQAAMARYSRVGFEAAAVSAVAVALAMLTPRRGLIRTAELRFGHPYAVVAVTADEPSRGRDPAAARGPTHGLPVFSAWVAQPEDAARDDPPADAPGAPVPSGTERR